MLRNLLFAAGLLNALLLAGHAQEPAVPPKPEVKLNYLNVCTPDAKDQEKIVSAHLPEALARRLLVGR